MFLDGLCDHAETPDMPTGLQNLNFRATQEIRENPGKIPENPGNLKYQISLKKSV